jgi:hypothetical protein
MLKPSISALEKSKLHATDLSSISMIDYPGGRIDILDIMLLFLSI